MQQSNSSDGSVFLVLASPKALPDSEGFQRELHRLCARAGVSILVAPETGQAREALNELLHAQYLLRIPMAHVNGESRNGAVPLTDRQREVLRLLADGYPLRRIGEALRISRKTVEFHKAQLMQKLGRRTNAELIKYAIEHGITSV